MICLGKAPRIGQTIGLAIVACDKEGILGRVDEAGEEDGVEELLRLSRQANRRDVKRKKGPYGDAAANHHSIEAPKGHKRRLILVAGPHQRGNERRRGEPSIEGKEPNGHAMRAKVHKRHKKRVNERHREHCERHNKAVHATVAAAEEHNEGHREAKFGAKRGHHAAVVALLEKEQRLQLGVRDEREADVGRNNEEASEDDA